MVTINIKENSKQAKAVLEMLKTFAFVEVVEKPVKLAKPVSKEKELTTSQKRWINRLKKVKRDIDAGIFKGKSAQTFLDEL